jgi:Protein of unknown function (DUF3309)
MSLLVLIVLLLTIGTLPAWSYSRGWGYEPSAGLSLLLAALITFALIHTASP